MVVQTAVQVHHVVHHVATDAIQVVKAVRHLPLVRVALIAVVAGAIQDVVEDATQDVVEDVQVVVPLIVKEVVVRDVRAVVVLHVLERVRKVAKHLVQANAEVLHVLAFVQILVTEVSVMEVVQGHVSLRAKVPAFILVI